MPIPVRNEKVIPCFFRAEKKNPLTLKRLFDWPIVGLTIICSIWFSFRSIGYYMFWYESGKVTEHTNESKKKIFLNYGYVNDACVSCDGWIKSLFFLSFPIEGGVGAGLQYPAYFKDAKGNNHSVFGSGNPLHYLKQGPKGLLPDIIQHGRTAGMPLYVRCPICQKEFKQKTTLLQHGCIHIESRPYPCPECGKRFRQQSHLTQHLRIHTNEKPYGCLYCPRFFRQRTILNQVGRLQFAHLRTNRFRHDS